MADEISHLNDILGEASLSINLINPGAIESIPSSGPHTRLLAQDINRAIANVISSAMSQGQDTNSILTQLVDNFRSVFGDDNIAELNRILERVVQVNDILGEFYISLNINGALVQALASNQINIVDQATLDSVINSLALWQMIKNEESVVHKPEVLQLESMINVAIDNAFRGDGTETVWNYPSERRSAITAAVLKFIEKTKIDLSEANYAVDASIDRNNYQITFTIHSISERALPLTSLLGRQFTNAIAYIEIIVNIPLEDESELNPMDEISLFIDSLETNSSLTFSQILGEVEKRRQVPNMRAKFTNLVDFDFQGTTFTKVDQLVIKLKGEEPNVNLFGLASGMSITLGGVALTDVSSATLEKEYVEVYHHHRLYIPTVPNSGFHSARYDFEGNLIAINTGGRDADNWVNIGDLAPIPGQTLLSKFQVKLNDIDHLTSDKEKKMSAGTLLGEIVAEIYDDRKKKRASEQSGLRDLYISFFLHQASEESSGDKHARIKINSYELEGYLRVLFPILGIPVELVDEAKNDEGTTAMYGIFEIFATRNLYKEDQDCVLLALDFTSLQSKENIFETIGKFTSSIKYYKNEIDPTLLLLIMSGIIARHQDEQTALMELFGNAATIFKQYSPKTATWFLTNFGKSGLNTIRDTPLLGILKKRAENDQPANVSFEEVEKLNTADQLLSYFEAVEDDQKLHAANLVLERAAELTVKTQENIWSKVFLNNEMKKTMGFPESLEMTTPTNLYLLFQFRVEYRQNGNSLRDLTFIDETLHFFERLSTDLFSKEKLKLLNVPSASKEVIKKIFSGVDIEINENELTLLMTEMMNGYLTKKDVEDIILLFGTTGIGSLRNPHELDLLLSWKEFGVTWVSKAKTERNLETQEQKRTKTNIQLPQASLPKPADKKGKGKFARSVYSLTGIDISRADTPLAQKLHAEEQITPEVWGSVAAATEIGQKYESNEDTYLLLTRVVRNKSGEIFPQIMIIVFDGIGTGGKGALASKNASQIFLEELSEGKTLEEAYARAKKEVREGMTTVSAVLINQITGEADSYNLGDSPIHFIDEKDELSDAFAEHSYSARSLRSSENTMNPQNVEVQRAKNFVDWRPIEPNKPSRRDMLTQCLPASSTQDFLESRQSFIVPRGHMLVVGSDGIERSTKVPSNEPDKYYTCVLADGTKTTRYARHRDIIGQLLQSDSPQEAVESILMAALYGTDVEMKNDESNSWGGDNVTAVVYQQPSKDFSQFQLEREKRRKEENQGENDNGLFVPLSQALMNNDPENLMATLNNAMSRLIDISIDLPEAATRVFFNRFLEILLNNENAKSLVEAVYGWVRGAPDFSHNPQIMRADQSSGEGQYGVRGHCEGVLTEEATHKMFVFVNYGKHSTEDPQDAKKNFHGRFDRVSIGYSEPSKALIISLADGVSKVGKENVSESIGGARATEYTFWLNFMLKVGIDFETAQQFVANKFARFEQRKPNGSITVHQACTYAALELTENREDSNFSVRGEISNDAFVVVIVPEQIDGQTKWRIEYRDAYQKNILDTNGTLSMSMLNANRGVYVPMDSENGHLMQKNYFNLNIGVSPEVKLVLDDEQIGIPDLAGGAIIIAGSDAYSEDRLVDDSVNPNSIGRRFSTGLAEVVRKLNSGELTSETAQAEIKKLMKELAQDSDDDASCVCVRLGGNEVAPITDKKLDAKDIVIGLKDVVKEIKELKTILAKAKSEFDKKYPNGVPEEMINDSEKKGDVILDHVFYAFKTLEELEIVANFIERQLQDPGSFKNSLLQSIADNFRASCLILNGIYENLSTGLFAILDMLEAYLVEEEDRKALRELAHNIPQNSRYIRKVYNSLDIVPDPVIPIAYPWEDSLTPSLRQWRESEFERQNVQSLVSNSEDKDQFVEHELNLIREFCLKWNIRLESVAYDSSTPEDCTVNILSDNKSPLHLLKNPFKLNFFASNPSLEQLSSQTMSFNDLEGKEHTITNIGKIFISGVALQIGKGIADNTSDNQIYIYPDGKVVVKGWRTNDGVTYQIAS